MDPILSGMAWQCFILCVITIFKKKNPTPADLFGNGVFLLIFAFILGSK